MQRSKITGLEIAIPSSKLLMLLVKKTLVITFLCVLQVFIFLHSIYSKLSKCYQKNSGCSISFLDRGIIQSEQYNIENMIYMSTAC